MQVVYAAYFVRFLTEPALASSVRDSPHALEGLVASLPRHGQQPGDVAANLEIRIEAAFLVAGTQGLQRSLPRSRSSSGTCAPVRRRLSRRFDL
jgi:hypothetical protein